MIFELVVVMGHHWTNDIGVLVMFVVKSGYLGKNVYLKFPYVDKS